MENASNQASSRYSAMASRSKSSLSSAGQGRIAAQCQGKALGVAVQLGLATHRQGHAVGNVAERQAGDQWRRQVLAAIGQHLLEVIAVVVVRQAVIGKVTQQ